MRYWLKAVEEFDDEREKFGRKTRYLIRARVMRTKKLTLKYWLRAVEEFNEGRERLASRMSTFTEVREVPLHVKRYLMILTITTENVMMMMNH